MSVSRENNSVPVDIEQVFSRVDLGKVSSVEQQILCGDSTLGREQIESYKRFLQEDVEPDKREMFGLHAALATLCPISNHSQDIELRYKHYVLGKPLYSIKECKSRGESYSMSVNALMELIVWDREQGGKEKGVVKSIQSQYVYIGEAYIMTNRASFIVNGTEKVIVAQMHRSPGVSFSDKEKGVQSTSENYAKIIPRRGAWIDFEIAGNNIYCRIDRKKRFPATWLLKSMGNSERQIMDYFYSKLAVTLDVAYANITFDESLYAGEVALVPVLDSAGKEIVAKGRKFSKRAIKAMKDAGVKALKVPREEFLGRILAKPVNDTSTGEELYPVNTEITDEIYEDLIAKGLHEISVIFSNETNHGIEMSHTLSHDGTHNTEEAMMEVYKVMRPGESPSPQAAERLIESLFLDEDRYNLSKVGRMKLNLRLGLGDSEAMTLSSEDMMAVVNELIKVKNGLKKPDDIDNLGNRRVRYSGEMIENQLKNGLVRVQKVIREKMAHPDIESFAPSDLINPKSIMAAVKEFMTLNPLSQLLDSVNPLSIITHTRKVSSLGPGGLDRGHAGFNVRDVHDSHNGRLCPIETPEGQNIGLINSLAMMAKTDQFGFLQTPYRVVKNAKITGEVEYLSALDEGIYYIASADMAASATELKSDDLIECRHQYEYIPVPRDQVTHIVVSERQILSIAASLIPFLEHNDTSRALMGSNMQRQAVPLLKAERPLVGTGMESVVARNSKACAIAQRSGVVKAVDGSRIIIQSDDMQGDRIDVYPLDKFDITNQKTYANQTPKVCLGDHVQEGQILADGSSVDQGELALGKNVRVAFMSWNGYNFEDSIIISDRLVKDDVFTSIHIQEFACVARDTKLGVEEITADIPNISSDKLAKLDECGIVYTGAQVEPGDILVGKVTPKGESQLSPEEKLLKAIFGEKASDIKDSSLSVPAGVQGTVIGVNVYTREGVEHDQRTKELLEEKYQQSVAEEQEKLTIRLQAIEEDLRAMLLKKTAVAGPNIKAATALTKAALNELKMADLFLFKFEDQALNDQLKQQKALCEKLKADTQAEIKKCKTLSEQPDTLAPGVIKVVNVYIAVKRKIKVGDKMAGRHGNKGVISVIVPEEDMPHTEDGLPVDIILNPLGVPSRMNIGQILETHLGQAVKSIGRIIKSYLPAADAADKIRAMLTAIYDNDSKQAQIAQMTDEQVMHIGRNFSRGMAISSPVFNGVSEAKIKDLLELSGNNRSGQVDLYDGRTGEKYRRQVTVGYMYMIKLNHLIDDKMHARSTGSYSLVTQQPLGGKAQFGGQRFGEMEVWALQGYGAAYTLLEMMTVKSDDVTGRSNIYKDIVNGQYKLNTGIPESFKVLVSEMRALMLDIQMIQDKQPESEFDQLNNQFVINDHRQTQQNFNDGKITIAIKSPEQVRAESYGEVTKPETINYRHHKPERGGLFCSAIFGPVKDFECLCGKYKRLKHRGIVCEKCGVEVTHSRVRRERMGHIELACPVAHVWFVKSLPSRMATLLGIALKDLERVLYFESYIVVDTGMTILEKGQLLTEDGYQEALEEYGDEFKAMMGAEAIKELLSTLDLEQTAADLESEIGSVRSESKQKKLMKRLRLIKTFMKSNNKPEWMIVTLLPVLPPDLRPLVALEGGRFATSDLNDLYRRVINRNNRLKRLLELDAPEIIIKNEKRMLQEAVDALFDNGRRGKPVVGTNKRPLKALTELLKGKQGRFRQNLLGKRVDYSGRTVIVAGPKLRLYQCGLPKQMALELFTPFILSKLVGQGYAPTVKSAKKILDQREEIVWDMLDHVIREHPVLLNRAPTLHRLGIQAFEPVLVEGKAIRLHPLVCTAFNADFDGDMMAVHVPLSIEAQLEARCLMMATNNLISSANGEPIVVPTKDMLLGIYYMTRIKEDALGEGKVFLNWKEALNAYHRGDIDLQARVKVLTAQGLQPGEDTAIETSPGRLMIYEIMPQGANIHDINKVLKKKDISNLILDLCHDHGSKATSIFCDQIMRLGFDFATKSGTSICIDDLVIPSDKASIISEAEASQEEIEQQYNSGLVTKGERYNKLLDIWSTATNKVEKSMIKQIGTVETKKNNGDVVVEPSFNSIFIMADSGARGSSTQLRQLAGMRGLMARPDGSIITKPIKANFREGLNMEQHLLTAPGARKGLTDTALKTANSGYLTRRLVDVSQDIIVSEYDCGTHEGVAVSAQRDGNDVIQTLQERAEGRVLAETIYNAKKEVLFPKGHLLSAKDFVEIEKNQQEIIYVRSSITCQSKKGVCVLCYGKDLARGKLINLGESVGIVAAQSIGEPGTQLTMRTFHIGGAASQVISTSSIQVRKSGKVSYDRIKVLKKEDGSLLSVTRSGTIMILNDSGVEIERHKVAYGAALKFVDNQEVKSGDVIATWDPYTHPIISEVSGKLSYSDITEGINATSQVDELTGLSSTLISGNESSGQKSALRPLLRIIGEDGQQVTHAETNAPAQFFLHSGCVITKSDQQEVKVGDVIARIPKERSQTRDITGGLPRVADLFEARKPGESSVLAEHDGHIHFGKETRDRRRLMIINQNGETFEELIPKWRNILVFEGENVKKGEVLVEGETNPHDLLRLLGKKELARYIVEEVQEVYRLQGVVINDKHIEIIIRQMLKKVTVIDAGDTDFIPGDIVDKIKVESANQALSNEQQGCIYEPILLGITKASLSTDSFISAASFQETTKVLTEAAFNGAVDDLTGLKENVMVGCLIPAGTGFSGESKPAEIIETPTLVSDTEG